ncbi:hypothetical protein Dimus_019081 [Dionaea muscipula]
MGSSQIQHHGNSDQVARPIANFQRDVWSESILGLFLRDDSVIKAQVKELKVQVQKELIIAASSQPLQHLISFIDTLERLGVAYHFEAQIEEALEKIYENYHSIFDAKEELDLYHTSILFRVLRQHAFPVSCDLFDKYKDENGSFKESFIVEDVKGTLALYEAAQLRVRGEPLLDEAAILTTTYLKKMVSQLISESDPLLSSQIARALELPLHRNMPRIASRQYIEFYEQDPSHNKSLLRFAKLDFNMVQSLHNQELKDHAKWWADLGIASKVPWMRERVAESYFWGSGILYESQHGLVRKMGSISCALATVVDDLYDSYGTIEELEVFTQAIESWDRECLSQLPNYMKPIYEHLILEVFEQFERDLVRDERSTDCVDYAREQFKNLCVAHLQETKWVHEKYVPSYDEYMEIATTTFGYYFATTVCQLCLGKLTTRETFEWISRSTNKIVTASSIIARLKNDLGGHKFQKDRDHVASAVDCYMKQYGVSEEAACEEIMKRVNEAWKDLIEEMLRSTVVPMPLLMCILNLTRVVEVLYYGGEDHYTIASADIMRTNIRITLIDPIPIDSTAV